MKIDDKAKVHRYNNAIKRKLNNNHVTLCSDDDGSYHLEVVNYDNKFAMQPCIVHQVKREVVRISHFRMNKETLEAFILNAIELLNMEELQNSRETELLSDLHVIEKT
jgi:hypothetical protein